MIHTSSSCCNKACAHESTSGSEIGCCLCLVLARGPEAQFSMTMFAMEKRHPEIPTTTESIQVYVIMRNDGSCFSLLT